jgi:hypothetical protein
MKTRYHDLLRDLERASINYANLRANWVIDACNMARAMRAGSEDARWREELGDDRKLIGDFGCRVAHELALRN